MLRSNNMTGSSELKGLCPLRTLRGQELHYPFPVVYWVRLWMLTRGRVVGGVEVQWLSPYSGSLCEKLPPTDKDRCVMCRVETHFFLSILAFHPH